MEEMNLDIQEVNQGAIITVVGVGGGGSNMVSYLTTTNPHHAVKLIAANTDIQHLQSAKATIKMKLGEKLTKGLGAGMQPDIGERAALETYEEIKAVLASSDIVFISAGLGGGTGTGAAPVIARAAKEVGALTISIVTKPFKMEGMKRSRFAEEGLKNLKAESDCLIVIPNDRLLSIIPKNCGIRESFNMVNDVLARAVNGIANIILNHGADDINVDFADVRTVMSHKGLALMGIGESSGESAASRAVRMAIESPLFDNISINDAMGILVNFEMHIDYPMLEVSEAMEIVNAIADANEADIAMGTRRSNDVAQDFVRVTIVATGFEKEVVGGNDSELSSKIHTNQKSLEQTRDLIIDIQRKKVSGDEFRLLTDEHDSIDVPTYLRNQKD